MDHDAMHRDVQNLKKFKTDSEEAIAFYKGIKAAGGMPAPGSTGVMSSAAVDQIVAKVVEQLGPKITDLTGRIETIEQKPAPAVQDMSSFDERLAKLESSAAPIPVVGGAAQDPDIGVRLEAMLTWFEANQDGLEVLLSLDGEVDSDVDAGTASGGATGASGAVSGEAGTNLPGTSQDASADAAKVVDRPTAQSGT